MFAPSILAKKTKAEILEEYEKLRSRLDELKANAAMVNAPANQEAMSKAQAQTITAIAEGIEHVKEEFRQHENDLVKNATQQLDQLAQEAFAKVRELDELQKAIDLSRKTLEMDYNIHIAADTLTILISDHDAKKKAFDEEFARSQQEREEMMRVQKRDREREQEEYAYATNLQHQRQEEEWTQERSRKEKELTDREESLHAREEETQQLQKTVELLPQRIADAERAKEKEVVERLTNEWNARVEGMKRDWDTEKRMAEFRLQNLEETIKQQTLEIAQLKKETELAVKKAQELAIKIVERGTHGERVEQNQVTPSSQQPLQSFPQRAG